MSYKHVGTAGDLVRFGCSLKVECTACGAARTMSAAEVCRVHESRARLEQLAARLKCRRCKKKAARCVVLPPV
jgi:hypothetical protein